MEAEVRQMQTSRQILGMLVPVYSTCLLCRMIRGLVSVPVPLHVLDLGGSTAEVGLLVSFYGIGYMMANVPGGFLLPCMGAKRTLLLACACFLLSTGICFVEDVRMLMVSQFLLGLANSLSALAQQTFISGTVPSERRGFALSIMGTLASLALALGPSLGSLLQGNLGIRAVFVAQLACGILAALVSFFLGEKEEAMEEALTPIRSESSGVLQAKDAVLQNSGRLLRVLCFACAVQCVRKGREFFFPLAGRQAGFSDVFIGQVAGWSFLVDMLVSPLAGQFMDSYGRRRVGAACLVPQSLGIGLLTFDTAEAFIAFGSLTGLGNGLSAGLLMTIGADLAPSGDGRGAFLAVYRLVYNSMEFITPALLCIITATVSLHAAELAAGATGLLGLLWVLGCVPETLQKQKNTQRAKVQL
ncbi:ywoG [Symbiodinium natans]|uniref:YwoG protein n=1 Tax=Symbiodinium natans TaxID=878477 RepID=A0A812LPL5_9DINO|nr:ywoG [Symbiodinium natans]